MLRLLDKLLRDVVVQANIGLVADQVRFEPPAKGWHTNIIPANQIALNIYLAELRENRKLRSNERVRDLVNGRVVEEQAPARLDCHYLISAWDFSTVATSNEPSLAEHDRLYAVATVLFRQGVLSPAQTYGVNPLAPDDWPTRFFDFELPLVVAPVEGFPKLAEFWGAMGQDHRWKPVLYVIVTVPIALVAELSGPPVATLITEHRLHGSPAPDGEVWMQIGGRVLRTQQPNNQRVPVQDAWVRLEAGAGGSAQTTTTDDRGQFFFTILRPGSYQLEARAREVGALGPLPVQVPSTQPDAYDLIF
jgi:hypothetical protein